MLMRIIGVFIICSWSISCTKFDSIHLNANPNKNLSCIELEEGRKGFEANSAIKVQNFFIFFDDSHSYRAFNLETNRFQCTNRAIANEVKRFDSARSKEMYGSAVRLENGEKSVKFFVTNSNGQSLQLQAEEICRKIGLNYLFGERRDNSGVVGCQATKNSLSAVMFRINNNDDRSITVAAMAIYAPIISQQIN